MRKYGAPLASVAVPTHDTWSPEFVGVEVEEPNCSCPSYGYPRRWGVKYGQCGRRGTGRFGLFELGFTNVKNKNEGKNEQS